MSSLLHVQFVFSKILGTYFVLPFRKFSSKAGGGERIACVCSAGIGEVGIIEAAGIITATFVASRSVIKGRFIHLSTISIYALSFYCLL